jgi:hypothetical protein
MLIILSTWGGRDRRIMSLTPVWAKVSETLSQKQNTNKMVISVAQVVEHLSSCEALGSILSTRQELLFNKGNNQNRRKSLPAVHLTED